jgi:hypothetical protein
MGYSKRTGYVGELIDGIVVHVTLEGRLYTCPWELR